jgi:hypothetical protein
MRIFMPNEGVVAVAPGMTRRLPILVPTFWNGQGVSDEQETQIFLATGLKSSWARVWRGVGPSGWAAGQFVCESDCLLQ